MGSCSVPAPADRGEAQSAACYPGIHSLDRENGELTLGGMRRRKAQVLPLDLEAYVYAQDTG